jgi:hypothetical protein
MENKINLVALCEKIGSHYPIKYTLYVKESEFSNKFFTIYLKDNNPYGNKIEICSGEFEDCKNFLIKWDKMLQ